MKYVSVRKNSAAAFLTATFAVLALSSFAVSTTGWWIRSVFELISLVFIVVAIQISQKHLLSGYEYILDLEHELTLYNRLTVIRTVGKRRTSLFTVPLSSLSHIIPYKRMRRVEKEYGKIGTKLSFCSDIFPKESYLLVFEDENELTLVRLQCDPAFAEQIEKRIGI